MWYDFFSLFYDRALEDLYAPFRPEAVSALGLSSGAVVLDAPCGTGHSIDFLQPVVGRSGAVLGVDVSSGMLHRARRRVDKNAWENVWLHKQRVSDIDSKTLVDAIDRPNVDGVLCSLGLSVFPEWEAAFESLFTLVRPGGRFVILDVFTPERTFQTKLIGLVARADNSREVWRPLQSACTDFVRDVLPADPKKFGGELFVASGTRPES